MSKPNAHVPTPALTATVTAGERVEATWVSPERITKWHVQLLNHADAVIRSVSVSQRRVVLTGLGRSTDYGLRVRAVDHDGRVSAWSDISKFSTAAFDAAEGDRGVDVTPGGEGRAGAAGADRAGNRGIPVDRPITAARRFVILPASPVADGVAFGDGLVVVRSRTSHGLEIYPGGVAEIPLHARRELAWIDDPPTGAQR